MEREQWGSTGAHTLPTRLYPTDFRGPPSSPVCWPLPVPTGKLALTKLCPHFLKLAPPLALLRPYNQLYLKAPPYQIWPHPLSPPAPAPKVLSSRVQCRVRMSGVRYCRLTTVT